MRMMILLHRWIWGTKGLLLLCSKVVLEIIGSGNGADFLLHFYAVNVCIIRKKALSLQAIYP